MYWTCYIVLIDFRRNLHQNCMYVQNIKSVFTDRIKMEEVMTKMQTLFSLQIFVKTKVIGNVK